MLPILAVALLLVGCSPISSGEITSKSHRAGYYQPVTYCAAYNNKGVCTVWAVRQDWHPPTWRFDLRQQDDPISEPKTGWAYVSEDTFNAYEVGDYYGEN